MRADRWSFRATSFGIALIPTAALFYFFRGTVHPLWFLVPMYWFMFIRDMKSRMRELNARMLVSCDMIALLVPEHSIETYETLLDQHGFYDEAEELDRLDRL